MTMTWLQSLMTATPQAGFDLAVKMSRNSIKVTQPSGEVSARLRSAYDQDTVQLIASSHVIAVSFQTIAAANSWWRHKSGRRS